MQTPSYGASDHYFGKDGEKYFAMQSGAGMFGARINARKFRDFVKPDDCILDFGCGGGFLLKTLECARRIGVDLNPAALAYAASLDIECYQCLSLVPDGVADLVISDHALEHVPFPIGALKELRAKLKPTGQLVLCVPIDNWRTQKRFNLHDQNHHLHTWTPQLLGNSLTEAGYEVLNVYPRIFAWPGRWTVATYGRLPYWGFRAICHFHGLITGKGTEILARARPHLPML